MSEQDLPLCVDLDGTMIRSDLLLESALNLFQHNFLYIFAFAFWLFRGKAHLKHEIAKRSSVDVTTLPYDSRVLELVRTECARRPVVLCTAADEQLAKAVAAHVGAFSSILASDGRRNLSGENKANVLRELYGERGFDYAGNEYKDLRIWRHARVAFVVNANDRVARRVASLCSETKVYPRNRTSWRPWIKALRIHQWLKNVLVFLPLLAAHRILDPRALGHVVAAFLIFGICASSVYLLNDLLDLGSDRKHPRKRHRPFASGQLPLIAGIIVAPLLTLSAFALALTLGRWFVLTLFAYYALTLSYSLRLKRIVMLDVVLLAGLYTIRIIAGAAAIPTGLSFWLLAFSMFVFLSLAMLKRYTELHAMRDGDRVKAEGRGYHVEDLILLLSLGGASGYISVLVLALYIDSTESKMLYAHPQLLWLLCPLLLYWISRVWIIAHRGAMHDDPVIFAVVDPLSRVVLVLAGLILVGAV
jgi:4-hydroxybenzoate polyprenyltransferase